MTATLVGSMNAGVLNPISFACLAPAGLQLSAQLAGALSLQASISVTPPTLAVQLEALLSAAAQLEAGIALGLPGVSFSASAAASLVASIEVQIGLLNVLIQLFAGASMFVYKYDGGTVSSLGGDLSSALTATPPPGLLPSSPVAGIMLGAGATAWATISPYFGGL